MIIKRAAHNEGSCGYAHLVVCPALTESEIPIIGDSHQLFGENWWLSPIINLLSATLPFLF